MYPRIMLAHGHVFVEIVLLIICSYFYGQKSIMKYMKKGVIIIEEEEKAFPIIPPGTQLHIINK